MRIRNRQLRLIPLILLSFAALAYLVLSFSPLSQFPVFGFTIPYLIFFFILLFVFSYSLFTFIFANKRRGLLMALLIIFYLILRLNKLNSPYFAILLVVLFGSLELLFIKRK